MGAAGSPRFPHDHRSMRIRRPLPVLALLAGTLLGACGDQGPTAPEAAHLSIAPLGANVTTFVVQPGSPSTFVIGDHKIRFDANAICDPLRSSYGPTEWDRPCVVAPAGVAITATWWKDANGRPQIDFQPALRFNPASNVTLWMMDREASLDAAAQILWIAPNGKRVDEAVADPTVATQVGSNGFMFRRIKHFSGYTVSTGRDAFAFGGAELY